MNFKNGKIRINKQNRKNFSLQLAIICFLIYLIVRASTGKFIYLDNSLNAKYIMGGSRFSTIILYIGTFSAIMLGIKSIKNNITNYYINCVLIIYIPIIIWIIIDLFKHSLKDVLGITTLNPFTFLMLFCVYAGTNDYLWKKMLKTCCVLSPLLIILSFGYTLFFLNKYGARSISYSPQILYLSAGFFALSVRALCYNVEKRDRITEFTILLALVCAILYNARGWIIQCILLFIFYIYIREKKMEIMKKFFLFVGIAILLIVTYNLILHYMPERIISLLIKFDTGFQSRIWQYEDLFSQYSLFDIFFGKGTFASYETTTYGTYMYFDNAFVNLFMKYGLFSAFVFLLIFLRVFFKSLLYRIPKELKGPIFIVLLFFLADIGLSVFCTVNIDLKFLIFSFVLGRCEILWSNVNQK